MKIYLLAIAVVCLSASLLPQTAESGSLKTKITTHVAAMPATVGGNNYVPPSATQRDSFKAAILSLLQGNYSSAASQAASFGYGVKAFTDTTLNPQKLFYVLEKDNTSTNYWGTYVFNPSPLRQQLVIQSPHPLFDTNTGKQGIIIFMNTGARAFFITGAHRCNSSDSSSCAGTTTVCSGATAKFSKSDQTHNTDSPFYYANEVLNSNISGMIAVQNHGFGKDPGDPDLIMSNGTKFTPATDYLSTVKAGLLAADSAFTFKIAHIDTTWTTLTGTTNMLGRVINGRANPCNLSASSTTGRFLHIEQAYTGLRDNEANMARLGTALSNAIPESPLPVELTAFTASAGVDRVVLTWSTATERNNYGFVVERRAAGGEFWQQLGFILGSGSSSSPKHYTFTDRAPSAGFLCYRLRQLDLDGSTGYSPETTVRIPLLGYMLYQAYPNPFNPSVTVTVRVPEAAGGQKTRLAVYDVLGRVRAELYSGGAEPGVRSYAFTPESTLPSGIYFIRYETPEATFTRKVVFKK